MTLILNYLKHILIAHRAIYKLLNMFVSVNSETLDKVSVSTTFCRSRLVSVSISTKSEGSRWVSVSTTTKFQSLDESRSRHPQNFKVSMSLGLDIHNILKSQWVSVSTTFKILSLATHCLDNLTSNFWLTEMCSLGVGVFHILIYKKNHWRQWKICES